MALLLKNALSLLKDLISTPIILTRLQKAYPTCHFYPGSRVDDKSILGRYNVIFRNACIIDSIIGDHTFIQKNSVVVNAIIGKFCSIAAGVNIGLGQHPVEYVSTHPSFYSVSQPIAKTYSGSDLFEPFKGRINIGHDVWIGQNVLVMDGLKIGTGAIIAAGAVVTKDVPPYAIVAGVPARVIKYRFASNMRKKIFESQWWDMSDDWLQKHSHLFNAPKKFLISIE